MIFASKERRKVAERLRQITERVVDVREYVGHTYISVMLFGMQVCARDELELRNGMQYLADLIDPTCEIVEDEPYSCHCTACGQGRMYPQMYWRYCPHCGARIVEEK